jgi:hypothetical protein
LPSNDRVIAYRRSQPAGVSFVIAANLSDEPAEHPVDGEVFVATDHSREGTGFDGHLAPWEAVVVGGPTAL